MRLYDHTTQRMRKIANLTDEALASHLRRTRTDEYARLERSTYGAPYRARREALTAERAHRT